MARSSLQTLTEPMYYILLSLCTECCGVDVMAKVNEISEGRVTVGPGTLYTMLSKFEEMGIVKKTREENRKKWYVITDTGKELLWKEQERLKRQIADGEKILL